MTAGRNDDAASASEDQFLGELFPQAAEHLAEQHAGDFDAEGGRARFLAWLAAHTRQSAGPADGIPGGFAESASVQSAAPSQILGELLATHPEAASLLAEASHRQALARSSAAAATQELAAAQAAQLGYEELRDRLDPRGRRAVRLGAGLAVLAAIIPGIFLVLLPVALQGFGLGLSWPASLGHAHGNVVPGFLSSIFILVLAAGATVLISRMEPLALLLARRRWHRARGAHAAATRANNLDTETATAAMEAWLNLVRAYTNSGPGSGARVIDETVALAAVLLTDGGVGSRESRKN
jgi:hypothetical protein